MLPVSDQQLQVEVPILLIIDDPHSEQDALNVDALERAHEWYTSGPRQRLTAWWSNCLWL
jgi:hypothetical protein